MNNQTLNRMLVNVTKREDFIKIIEKLVNLDKKNEEWFRSYIISIETELDLRKIEDDILLSIQDFKFIFKKAIDSKRINEKTNKKLLSILELLKQFFVTYDFSSEFKKSTAIKMTHEYFWCFELYEEKILEIIDEMFKTDEEKVFIADYLSKRYDIRGLRSSARLYKRLNLEDKYISTMRKIAVMFNNKESLDVLYNYYKEKSDTQNLLWVLELGVSDILNAYDCIPKLMKEYEELGLYDKIISLENFIEAKNFFGLTIYYERMVDYVHDYDSKKKYLLKWKEECQDTSINKCYEQCKAILTEQDFNAVKSDLIAKYKRYYYDNYHEFLISIGSYDEVITYVTKHLHTSRGPSKSKCERILKIILEKSKEEAANFFCSLLLSFSRKRDPSLLSKSLELFTARFREKNMYDFWKEQVENLAKKNPQLILPPI